MGCLIWELYNGPLERREQLTKTGKIPKALLPHYAQLLRCGGELLMTDGCCLHK